jgi:hypothetical protein
MTEQTHTVRYNGPRPKIVALIGPTQNTNAFVRAHRKHTLDGWIVVGIGGGSMRTDYDVESGVPVKSQPAELEAALVELQKRRIELADEVFVVNQYGRIGDGTRAEIEYATSLGKPVRYLEEPT